MVERQLKANHQRGWASRAITENGMVRIMSLPRYRPEAPLQIADLISRLKTFKSQTDHEFWGESLSICDPIIQCDHILGSRAITDVWLLGLAVSRERKACNHGSTNCF